MKSSQIIWTKTDEAPALASFLLLPIVRSFLKHADIAMEELDISLAGRILANLSDRLPENLKVQDHLTELIRMVRLPEANIIKLPNISASIPQLKAAIKELQEKGYPIPDYPQSPTTFEEKKIQAQYANVLGSAVNPILREGNSDRRAADSVKSFAKKNPNQMMKPWPANDSSTQVAYMMEKDFFASEQSVILDEPCIAKIDFIDEKGNSTALKQDLELIKGEVIDTSVMNIKALNKFYEQALSLAKEKDALFSLHLKATMMKVSDPIMFGHCVAVFFNDLLKKHAKTFEGLSMNLNNGLADVLAKLQSLPDDIRSQIENDIEAVYEKRPGLAMVDSDKGITNLHVPNNVIIDASMPNIIRDGGKMWDSEGSLADTIAVIPDRSYATIYQTVIDDCNVNGQFDPAVMGSVSNVGLMAKKAEEYGSHDKTFEAQGAGTIKLLSAKGQCIMEQTVEQGDIFRMCQTKDVAVRDWVRLGVERARLTGAPAVFWLNPERAHDQRLIEKIETYLTEHDTSNLDIRIMPPDAAMDYTLKRVRQEKDTIAITGNVLRDYLTDLFPILELGTSSRMLSIVPLLNGGGLFETGAGGSAPKHVQQFLEEGHLRWDSLGEYCALVPSLELAAATFDNPKAAIFAKALDKAIGQYLESGRGPSRNVNEIDNRGATFYIALYWTNALAAQSEDDYIRQIFKPVACQLNENEGIIFNELLSAQGKPVEIEGYFMPDPKIAAKQMRPSATFNQIVDHLAVTLGG
ncbi:MAG: NADP-dependent isocitrate dehydrogenase [Desulfobacteraceae bacterium]|nr:NADP-dependent isocitrate dehydrogenase [Desulfobacteraceae bacterium]